MVHSVPCHHGDAGKIRHLSSTQLPPPASALVLVDPRDGRRGSRPRCPVRARESAAGVVPLPYPSYVVRSLPLGNGTRTCSARSVQFRTALRPGDGSHHARLRTGTSFTELASAQCAEVLRWQTCQHRRTWKTSNDEWNEHVTASVQQIIFPDVGTYQCIRGK